jgi:hypothetical protein
MLIFANHGLRKRIVSTPEAAMPIIVMAPALMDRLELPSEKIASHARHDSGHGTDQFTQQSSD